MKAFLEELEKNSALKASVEALNGRPDSTPADFIALAAEHGFTLTEADFAPAPASGELDDDELDAVAGGGGCGCAGAGGGGGKTTDGKTYGCACVFYGQGGDGKGGIRCYCGIAGGGADF